jgi:LuxR family transcriptional regulator, maltose regulon positive regulatory protein
MTAPAPGATPPVLATKLHPPPRRRGAVSRPRLTERASEGELPALTLVSAPPGFGKTTFLADLSTQVVADGASIAWLALDHRDNDPTLFWSSVVAALSTAAPVIGQGALSLLGAGQPSESVVASLLDDLTAHTGDVVLVLDDYHVIESTGLHEAMTFLVEHAPSHLHLVLAGRADPPMPLPRLRARGDLLEIRAADLRFTPAEAATYLHEAMGLQLTAEDVDALAARTEGWIAALQLAALSMQGCEDTSAFVAGFSSEDRFLLSPLV